MKLIKTLKNIIILIAGLLVIGLLSLTWIVLDGGESLKLKRKTQFNNW